MVSVSPRNALLAAAFVLGVAASASQASAQARCELQMDPGADQWIIRHNPLEDDSAYREFDLALSNTGSTPCNGRFRVSLRGEPFGLAAPGGAERVSYLMRDQQSGADLTPRSGESGRITGQPIHVPREGRELARIGVVAAPSAALAHGRYAQQVYIALEAPNGELQAERPVTLVLEAASAAVIGLKGEFTRSGGTPVIDLGELSEGARTLSTAVYVHSTGGYRVSVTSQNQGRLRQDGTAWTIDYDLKLGARDVNLSGPYSFDVVSAQARRDDYPLTFNIGETIGKRAGEYRDVLTFTVAAI